jgi:hypothetical protein
MNEPLRYGPGVFVLVFEVDVQDALGKRHRYQQQVMAYEHYLENTEVRIFLERSRRRFSEEMFYHLLKHDLLYGSHISKRFVMLSDSLLWAKQMYGTVARTREDGDWLDDLIEELIAPVDPASPMDIIMASIYKKFDTDKDYPGAADRPLDDYIDDVRSYQGKPPIRRPDR